METLALIKPDAMKNKYLSDILNIIEENSTINVVKFKSFTFTPELVIKFYAEHTNKEFFPRLSDFMCSGPTTAIVLSGPDVVNKWRTMIGPTNPENGQFSNHLRARFGTDTTHNALHGSANPADALREIDLIFEENKSKPLFLDFVKEDPDAILPKRATPGSAGLDIFSLEDVELYPLSPAIIRTGLGVKIPEGFEGQIRTRSGLGSKGVVVVNAPGTVDSDYRGEVKVSLIWWTGDELKSPTFSIKKGDRIAQLVVCPIEPMEPKFVDKLDQTERAAGGFGSTGQ